MNEYLEREEKKEREGKFVININERIVFYREKETNKRLLIVAENS